MERRKNEREESSEREMKVGQERSIKHILFIIYIAQKVDFFSPCELIVISEFKIPSSQLHCSAAIQSGK